MILRTLFFFLDFLLPGEGNLPSGLVSTQTNTRDPRTLLMESFFPFPWSFCLNQMNYEREHDQSLLFN